MNWRRVKALARRVRNELPRDGFSRALLHGAMLAALDSNNPVRGNLFATAIRELIGFSLDGMAPDASIYKCGWYEQDAHTNGPTRKQKFSYICHRGLSPLYIEEELGLEIDKLHMPLREAFKKLHKATHVRPGSVVFADPEVRELVASSLSAVLSIFGAAETCQKAVCDALLNEIHDSITDKLMSEVYDSLDELSTHTRVDGHNIEDIDITSIDHATITYEVEGSVDVELQYGSDSDVRNDMGAVMDDSYPYNATLTAEVTNPSVFKDANISIDIDNSSFFE